MARRVGKETPYYHKIQATTCWKVVTFVMNIPTQFFALLPYIKLAFPDLFNDEMAFSMRIWGGCFAAWKFIVVASLPMMLHDCTNCVGNMMRTCSKGSNAGMTMGDQINPKTPRSIFTFNIGQIVYHLQTVQSVCLLWI